MKMKSLMKGILALTVLFSVALGVILLPKFTMVVNAEEIVASGTCGDPNVEEGKNVTWSLDDKGTLTISGTGDMFNIETGLDKMGWDSYKSNIKKVIIDEGVTSIGRFNFENATSLTTVKIPKTVATINEMAFIGCSNLSNVEFSEGLKQIKDCAFSECSSLTELVLPDSLENIRQFAFDSCSNLSSVTIPNNNLFQINDSAFENCSSLTSFIVTSDNNYFKTVDGVLFSVDGKELVRFPNGKGESYTVPDGVTSIGKNAFAGNTKLTSITLSASVESIEDYAFARCTALDNINFSTGLKSIGSKSFGSCWSFKSIIIPDGVTHIGKWAFMDIDLSYLSLPSSLSFETTPLGDLYTSHTGVELIEYYYYRGTVEQYKSAGGPDLNIGIICLDGTIFGRIDMRDRCSVDGIPDQVYTGDEILPQVIVKYSDYTLREDIDYKLSYIDNTNVGEASVYVEGTGNSRQGFDGTIIKHFNIIPKSVVAPTIVLSQESFVYDGQEHKPTVTLKDGDKVIDASEYTVKYSDDCTKVGEKTITITDNEGGNYTVNGTGTFTITPKPLNVTGITASDKIYDGTVEATISGNPVLDGIVGSDDVSVTAGNAEFKDANAGTAKEVVLTGFTLSGNDKDNYELKTTATANITPKEVTVSGIKAQNKSYDGTTTASLDYTGVTFNGKLDKDVLTVTATGTFSSKEVGTDKNVSISNLILGGASAGNYKLAHEGNQTSAKASITACVHAKTEVRNKVDATKTLKGYTGDTYCKTCGKLLSKGKDVEKLPDDKAKTSYSNEWVDGKWYNADGICDYAGTLSWKNDETGWWVEDSEGWYPVAQWQKIDGKWYYFDASGYMASNEWIDGCWLGGDGAWEYQYIGSWKTNGSGWWFEDESGWYPSSQWQKIDGKWYYFGSDGIMLTNQYVGDCWVGSDGSWQ